MPINLRLKAIYIIIIPKKTLCKEIISESSSMRIETVDIDILITSRIESEKSFNLLK